MSSHESAGMLDQLLRETEQYGSALLWRGSQSGTPYACRIEMSCPVVGGNVQVAHWDKSWVTAVQGALIKARQMTAIASTAAAERISHVAR